MLEMRKNMVHYVQLIDLYAPCVVSKRAWNNEANMAAYCGSNNRFFEQFVLSISDEAFLLVVLDNYSACWQAEYANNIKKVCACVPMIRCANQSYTYTRLAFAYSIGTVTSDDEEDMPVRPMWSFVLLSHVQCINTIYIRFYQGAPIHVFQSSTPV